MNKTTEARIPVVEALQRDTRPRVMLGLPSGDEVKMDYALSLVGMAIHSCLLVRFEVGNPRSCYVQVNRNDIVRESLNSGLDWIFWIDRDMEFPPDALLRLLSHGKDIVGATYIRRSPPYQSLMGRAANKTSVLSLEGLEPMDLIPTGLLLTKVDVFKKLQPPWFWLTHHPDGSVDLGDDSYFCVKAREAGMGVWCDKRLTSEIAHHCDIGLRPAQSQFPGGGLR